MKFELNNKTGMMEPKQNKQIYFSRSMSGGLRVDDHINNIKYIIEKDGNIKFIFGEKKVNIYDQRNAHIIADRVKRMFGPENKYSNYKMFLTGCHIIKNYNDFISEGLWNKGLNRKKGDIRKEEGIKVEVPFGTEGYVILNDKGCGIPYKLNSDEDEYWFTITVAGEEIYLFGYEEDGTYTYFEYNEDHVDADNNLLQVAVSDYDMTSDEFILLRAILNSDFNNKDNLNFLINNGRPFSICETDSYVEYYMFDDYDEVRKYAYDRIYDYIENETDDKQFERWIDYFGNDFLDMDSLEEMMKETYESYCNDIEKEDGIMDNRLFDELEEAGLIEDSDEYFETNEDDELDYENPLFNIEDKKEELVQHLCDNYDDAAEWYNENFGGQGLVEYLDKDKLTDLIIDSDGIEQSIGASNSFEFNEDGYDIYCYEI